MKKKRLLATTLLVATVLVGCSSEYTTNNQNDQTNMKPIITTEPNEEPVESTPEPTLEPTKKPEIDINQVLYEDKEYKVTLLRMEEGRSGTELKVQIENNSNKNITMQARDMSVNGFMINPIFSADLVSGKKANDSITLPNHELEEQGINSINEVEFLFIISNSEDFSDRKETKKIKITFNESQEETVAPAGETLYEKDGIKIIYKNALKNEYGHINVNLYIENNTKDSITIQARDTSVDGLMIDPIMSIDIEPGKKIHDKITFPNYKLEENSIDTFTSIETKFNIIKNGSFSNATKVPVEFDVEITEQ